MLASTDSAKGLASTDSAKGRPQPCFQYSAVVLHSAAGAREPPALVTPLGVLQLLRRRVNERAHVRRGPFCLRLCALGLPYPMTKIIRKGPRRRKPRVKHKPVSQCHHRLQHLVMSASQSAVGYCPPLIIGSLKKPGVTCTHSVQRTNEAAVSSPRSYMRDAVAPLDGAPHQGVRC